MLHYGIRLSVAVATFLLSLAVSAIPALWSASPPAGSWAVSEREVLRANREYLEAHMSRDVAALEGLLADEFVIGGPRGRATSKAQRLAMIADGDLSFRYEDQHEPRVLADEDKGEVTGLAVVYGSHLGREFTSPPYRYVRKFEKRDGRWQVVGVEVYRGGWR